MQSKSWCFPRQLLVLMLAGWINRHQQAVSAYQREETKVLREMLGGKRLRFTDGQRRPGRLPKPQHIRDLVARLAKENTSWGYTELRDVIFTLGHEIGRTTVRRILAEDGIEPACPYQKPILSTSRGWSRIKCC